MPGGQLQPKSIRRPTISGTPKTWSESPSQLGQTPSLAETQSLQSALEWRTPQIVLEPTSFVSVREVHPVDVLLPTKRVDILLCTETAPNTTTSVQEIHLTTDFSFVACLTNSS